MKKIIFLLATSLTILSSHSFEDKKDYYIVFKSLMGMGEEVKEENEVLNGTKGFGLGLDFGYRLNHNFALEYDLSYEKNSIEREGEKDITGKYQTHGLDIVYTHHFNHHIGVFIKAGLEFEHEMISDLDINNFENGLAYGLGVEAQLYKNVNFLIEYEQSTIKGSRGDALFVGILYEF